MSEIIWDLIKNQKLKAQRGVSFEELLECQLVNTVEHPKRAHQNLMLFERNGYIWVVPYVIKGDAVFLKTLFPSRKYTHLWKKGELK